MPNLPRPKLTNPLLGTLLGILIYQLLLGRPLQSRFINNEGDFSALVDGVIFLSFFIAFLIAVHLIRKQPTPNFPSQNGWLIALLTAPLILAIVWALAETSGYLDLVFDISFGDVGNAYYFLITPGIYLFFGLLYFLTVRTKVEKYPSWSYPRLLLSYLIMTLFASLLATIFTLFLPFPPPLRILSLIPCFLFPYLLIKVKPKA